LGASTSTPYQGFTLNPLGAFWLSAEFYLRLYFYDLPLSKFVVKNFTFKNVHFLGTSITHLLDHNPAIFPTITQIHCFPLFVLFHSFHSYALRMLMIVTWCIRYRIRCFPYFWRVNF
jgi:hypothetical protein